MHRGPGLPLDYPVKQGIRIIKLFAWEKDFVSKIDKSRSDEMRSLRGYMVRYFRWLCFLSCMLALLTAVVRLLLSLFFLFRWPHLRCAPFIRQGRHTVSRNGLSTIMHTALRRNARIFLTFSQSYTNPPAVPAVMS